MRVLVVILVFLIVSCGGGKKPLPGSDGVPGPPGPESEEDVIQVVTCQHSWENSAYKVLYWVETLASNDKWAHLCDGRGVTKESCKDASHYERKRFQPDDSKYDAVPLRSKYFHAQMLEGKNALVFYLGNEIKMSCW
jgi:hypothetical protein